MGIQTVDDCVSHRPWVNKTSSSIISHHDHDYRIVTSRFSLMLRQTVFSVKPDWLYQFFKAPIWKGLSNILDSQQSNNRVTLCFPLAPVALVILSNRPRQFRQNWLHLSSFPCSDRMDVLIHSKIHVVPHRLGDSSQKENSEATVIQLCSWLARRRPVIVSWAWSQLKSSQLATKIQIILYYSVCQANTHYWIKENCSEMKKTQTTESKPFHKTISLSSELSYPHSLNLRQK